MRRARELNSVRTLLRTRTMCVPAKPKRRGRIVLDIDAPLLHMSMLSVSNIPSHLLLLTMTLQTKNNYHPQTIWVVFTK